MADTTLRLLRQLYETDSRWVWILNDALECLWKNHAADQQFTEEPDFQALRQNHGADSELLPCGDYLLPIGATLRLPVHLNTAPDARYYLLTATETAAHTLDQKLLYDDVARQRSQIFGISSAVQQLYEVFDALDCDSEDFYAGMQQLNTIMGNCARFLKSTLIREELLKYEDPLETVPELLDCAAALESFCKQSQAVFGRSSKVRLIAHAAPGLHLSVHPMRMQFCLICLLLTLRGNDSERNRFTLYAEQKQDDVLIQLQAGCAGTDESGSAHLLSDYTPDYPEITFRREQEILNRFCETYHAHLLRLVQNGTESYLLRIPLADISKLLHFQADCTTTQKQNDLDVFSLFQIMYADIFDCRYY